MAPSAISVDTPVGDYPPKVWTTLLTNTAYLTGLLTLDYSLKRSKSLYPLIVLYTDELPAEAHEALDRRGIRKRHVPYLLPSAGNDYSNDPRFYDCWTKMVPFGLTEFERIVQLDSDMLVMRNMDELMTIKLDSPALEGKGDRVFAASHACVCNPLKRAHYPSDWVPENCAYTHQHGKPDEAQTTGSPCTTGLQYMNGGLQVVNPSKAVYDLILKTLDKPQTADYAFADQSLLSDLFRGRWVGLPYVYNALKTLRWKGVHDSIWRDEEVKNVHYILAPKPWNGKEVHNEADLVTHGWFWDMNEERKKAEKEAGIDDDY
ncbi:glycosyltransferase family 8 protein [Bipolaris maydis ATCC 48331]|uniref:Glycosyltransferase family 8 protein n=2 Tax=Cochliobolus heterostrophus TaxID=5016 RepID=M2UL19_COCH5|nr:glycosyltransferase family 8 protein [Bipolaris maydis ATCC 48331]EMD94301.1 glycosyltransferase family 8 protein [Bipolaris maydis C5]KAJ5026531.1 glycosyltransferase [Bipolaris maydis]ENI07401.1 glycosyltransferase family 8 protein [Bipolaris maydis ATCC 48331]KAJ5059744.1 glycosyl transferase [Bipolaris maydis]KAJ6197287.1 glycosyl transferase [Bipolaris maydis]